MINIETYDEAVRLLRYYAYEVSRLCADMRDIVRDGQELIDSSGDSHLIKCEESISRELSIVDDACEELHRISAIIFDEGCRIKEAAALMGVQENREKIIK
ncbi:hypothetical protein [Butyrivibrio sp. FCS014]|uniref:hypothetical protein n=1 Tax=Butyrivibrio sp. FCS014 TaxID=1408304 RepID=UPI0012DD1EC7|nr:hypothetical protein [Butyrivibrio sp. FCS014]